VRVGLQGLRFRLQGYRVRCSSDAWQHAESADAWQQAESAYGQLHWGEVQVRGGSAMLQDYWSGYSQ
jgi:hypothetical protein